LQTAASSTSPAIAHNALATGITLLAQEVAKAKLASVERYLDNRFTAIIVTIERTPATPREEYVPRVVGIQNAIAIVDTALQQFPGYE
jgi:hypothetical protein